MNMPRKGIHGGGRANGDDNSDMVITASVLVMMVTDVEDDNEDVDDGSHEDYDG